MKITLSGYDFNRVMRVCTPSLSKDTARLPLMYILFECNGEGIGCATSLDGFTLAQTRFNCEGDACKMMVFQHAKVKDDLGVVIESNGERTSISVDDVTITKNVPPAEQYVNHTKICKDAQKKKKTITIAFNPNMLSTIVKSHKDHSAPLFFDIYEEQDAVVVHTGVSAGLLLPVAIRREINSPEFWEMIADGD